MITKEYLHIRYVVEAAFVGVGVTKNEDVIYKTCRFTKEESCD